MPSTFQAGDPVIAVGLTKASHLNGQQATVYAPAPHHPGGRVAVYFVGDEDNIKHIRPENLELDKIPLDQDDPRWFFLLTEHGQDLRCPLRIENGAGHQCHRCAVDLDGRMHVIVGSRYYCEEHYLQEFTQEAELEPRYCAVCHEYISMRENVQLPINEALRQLYPHGRLPNGRRLELASCPGVAWTHAACGQCALCRRGFCENNVLTPYAIRRFNDDRHRFLCAAAPGRDDGCENEWEDCALAKKRWHKVQAMSVEELQALLRERHVPSDASDDHDSLVRKVLVTDAKKGRKRWSYATDGVQASLYETRLVPGALLRDRTCPHGSIEPMLKESMGDLFMQYLVMVKTSSDLCEASVSFWASRLPLLRGDLEKRTMARELWSLAVLDAIEAEGYYELIRIKVSGSMVIGALQDMLEQQPSKASHSHAMRFLKSHARLQEFWTAAANGPNALYAWMHRQDMRRCNCMAYVATAAELGLLRDKQCTKTQVEKVEIQHCALCDNTLIAPKVCSACKEVAYCNPSHQREHWKIHKKTCKGRVKG